MTRTLLVLALVFTGCRQDDDLDGDGFAGLEAGGRDCDDADESIYPGAEEACDDVDQDCDDAIDEGVSSTFFVDGDGDGYGDDDSTVEGCSAPAGASETAGDCDDGDDGVFPGAEESCDEVDQDCDESVDEEPVDGSTYYADDDGDGYGDTGDVYTGCEAPSEYVSNGEDCDDRDDDNRPGGTELCDGEDNDCDGDVDEDGALDALEWNVDADGDGYGDPLSTVFACEQPSGAVEDDGDCDDEDGGVYPDATEVFDGVDNDCDGDVDRVDAGLAAEGKLLGEAGSDQAGGMLRNAGDIDGDGLDDLIIGSRYESTVGSNAGAAYVLSGTPTGNSLLSAEAAKLTGEAAGDNAGVSVDGVGDLNGDGFGDLLIGARGEDAGASNAGAAYVVLGPVTADASLSSAHARLLGVSSGDYSGIDVAGPGDVTGDGVVDLVVGARFESTNADGAGAVYVMSGPVTGDVSLEDATAIFFGVAEGDEAGRYLNSAGDTNGDGVGDLIIGATEEGSAGEGAGAAYVVLGPVSGWSELDDVAGVFTGEEAGDSAGIALTGVGDVDGDGYDEVLIGAPQADAGGTRSGAAYLIYGPATGEHSLADADVRFVGPDTAEYAGMAVNGGGDVNDDGFSDLLIGAPGSSVAAPSAGAAYLVLGSSTLSGDVDLVDADAAFFGEAESDGLGSSVDLLGDQDGDGFDEIVIGANLEDTTAADAGAVYVILGEDL